MNKRREDLGGERVGKKEEGRGEREREREREGEGELGGYGGNGVHFTSDN